MTMVWATMTETIFYCTGLSPTAFFTIVAMMVVTYKVVCGMFVSGDDFVPVKRQPLHLGDMTEEELRAYNGSDSKKPLLMAIKGQIYDVSSSKLVSLYTHTQKKYWIFFSGEEQLIYFD
ncbi:hypothetical protein HAX54_053274 [Datura stramonium]|uniref:Cytochrome b5 heme-binding domain-containing protein n=1 Tax=Datura stramonium TaxID=4076 RepID=A0ABS8T0Q7_DATST|nr:hypothetical protein [Datura stramonium]